MTDDAAKQKRERAAREAERALIETAHRNETITYLGLTKEITSVNLAPNSTALEVILTKLSKQSNRVGLGMLSVVVVNQDSGLPGNGFFDLARSLDRDVGTEEEFFEAEFNLVCRCFKEVKDRIPPPSPR